MAVTLLTWLFGDWPTESDYDPGYNCWKVCIVAI